MESRDFNSFCQAHSRRKEFLSACIEKQKNVSNFVARNGQPDPVDKVSESLRNAFNSDYKREAYNFLLDLVAKLASTKPGTKYKFCDYQIALTVTAFTKEDVKVSIQLGPGQGKSLIIIFLVKLCKHIWPGRVVVIVTCQRYLVDQFGDLATGYGIEDLVIATPDALPDLDDQCIYVVDEAEACMEDFGLCYGAGEELVGMR